MSMRPCNVSGCPHYVREGLTRRGEGNSGQPLADGRTCWRCRARDTTPESRSRARTEAAAQLERDIVARRRFT